ncbi:WG repeat-containing protein [uncultured Flavonifractor sp.]|uniref:WG repeat-containing protein n=1 Tax=uncultured Flavonifractor sp. TaxID=1193534 RepID=UPI0026390D73|nr:WG repeat-containing protein [uncultured Flavonifractor sp.]
MAARLIRPELRQEFTLKTVDDSRYTLTPLDLKGGKADGDWATSSLLPVTYEDHWALYRADGTWYTPEEGMVFLDANEDGLVMMQAADDTYAVVDSSRDWTAVPFTPNWSCKLLGDGNFISQASYDADPILHDRTGAAIATLTGDGHWDVLSDGLAPCLDESARLYGFVDTKGEWVIPAQYIEVKYFRDGYAALKQEGGWGVIDTTGKLVIPCAQPSLEHRGGPWFYSSSGQWLAADGSAVPAAASSYNGQNITLTGDYFLCGTYYLDRNFQPVTPQIFDWTGPVDENGCAFVGLDGATYRITLKA